MIKMFDLEVTRVMPSFIDGLLLFDEKKKKKPKSNKKKGKKGKK
jgi:hypothetical protein